MPVVEKRFKAFFAAQNIIAFIAVQVCKHDRFYFSVVIIKIDKNQCIAYY